MANLNNPTNPIAIPNYLNTANDNAVALANKIRVGATSTHVTGGNSVEDWLTSLDQRAAGGEPSLYNIVFLASGGDDANDGTNLEKSVASFVRAMTLARAMVISDHKVIFSYEARNYGDLINNNTTGNVANLIVDGRSSIFEDITLADHFTSIICRRIIGNVVLASNCNLDTHSINYTQPQTVTFTSQVHAHTSLRASFFNSNTTLSFAGAQSGSYIHVEIQQYDADLDTCLGTIPENVTVTGFIETHIFGVTHSDEIDGLETRVNTLEAEVEALETVENISEVSTPRSRRLMIGAGSHNYLNNGQVDEAHWDDVFALRLEGTRIGLLLNAKLTLDKHVSGVSWPSQYYYRDTGTTILPTTDGSDTAESDLRNYMGSSKRMFYYDSETHASTSNSSKWHTLKISNINVRQKLAHIDQNSDLIVAFNFPGFNVDISSFIGTMVVRENTGEGQADWTDKVRVRFDRQATNRYTMTLGTASDFNDNALKVSNIFNVSSHHVNLNAGGRTNEVEVNGLAVFNIPYIANSIKLVEINFETAIVVS